MGRIAARFKAAHRLVGNFGPATRTHGHTYRLEVILRGQQLGDDGTLYDIGELGQAVEGLAGSMHYRDLNEVPGLADVNTTAEAVASYCKKRIAAGADGVIEVFRKQRRVLAPQQQDRRGKMAAVNLKEVEQAAGAGAAAAGEAE